MSKEKEVFYLMSKLIIVRAAIVRHKKRRYDLHASDLRRECYYCHLHGKHTFVARLS